MFINKILVISYILLICLDVSGKSITFAENLSIRYILYNIWNQ